MRARILLVLFFLLVLPGFFLYAEENKTEDEKNPKPAFEGEANICVSENVSVKDGKLVTEQVATTTSAYKPRYDQCIQANNNKGCTAELEKTGKCKCGTVTYTVTPDGKPCSVSKCDENKENVATQCVEKGGVSLPALMKRRALEESVEAGKLPSWVEDALTPEQLQSVKTKIASNPTAAAEQLGGLFFPKNEAERQEAAKALNITPEQLKKLAVESVRLAPTQNTITGGNDTDTLFGGGTQFNAQQTFGDPSGQIALAPRGAPSSPTYKRGSQEMINPNVLGTLAADAQRKLCAAIQGTCYVTTEAQFATMMNETNGDVRALGDGGHSASLAQAYANQSAFNTYLARYRAVFGEDYVLHKINIKDSSINPEWIASQSVRMQAIILQDKAQATGGNFLRQITAYNGSGAAAAAYGQRALNNAYLLQNGRASQYWQSAFNTAKEGGGPSVTNLPASDLPLFTGSGNGNYSGSPFGNVSPFGGGYRSGFNTVAPVGVQGGGIVPGTVRTGGFSNTQQPVKTAEREKEDTSSGTSTKSILRRARDAVKNLMDAIAPSQENKEEETGLLVDPVATLHIQPQTITRGEPILVSWSSLGMSTVIPCRVLVTSGTVTSLIKEGNDGSERIETNSSMPSGTWKFMLRCTALKSGSLVDREVEVTVQ